MTTSLKNGKIIGIIGGTGKEGKGLAFCWAKSGHQIIIGSRSMEKACAAAEEINGMGNGIFAVQGTTNQTAADKSDIVVLTVPYLAHQAICHELKSFLQGKIVIDVTVPLVPPKVTKVQMPEAGSATFEAQKILGDQVQVVAAFQNISYENLLNQEELECDVLVSGGDKAARGTVLELVKDAGLTGWDAGPVENSMVVEGLTSILIGLNKQFGVHSSGIRITGIPRE